MIRTVRPPFLFKKIYSELTWKLPGEGKTMYLTFDDGPVPGVTTEVLEILDRFNAKGTFFCIGKNIEENPGIFQQVKDKGHAVGNHTYHHLNGWASNDKLYFESTERTRSLVQSKLFRPPYGRITKSQINLLLPRYQIIMWNVLSYDYDKDVSEQECLQNVLTHSGEGSIVIFHDSVKAASRLRYALPRMLEHFTKEGYQFKAIPQ